MKTSIDQTAEFELSSVASHTCTLLLLLNRKAPAFQLLTIHY
jgi:hypothetical protein